MTNLERIVLTNSSSANEIRNYIEGAELTSPQAKKIIDEQKKLMPKHYQNSYYKRKIFFGYGNYNCNSQATAQLIAQIAKSITIPQNSFFQERGREYLASPFKTQNNNQPTYPRSYHGKKGHGSHENKKY
jgi:hypothetical protein